MDQLTIDILNTATIFRAAGEFCLYYSVTCVLLQIYRYLYYYYCNYILLCYHNICISLSGLFVFIQLLFYLKLFNHRQLYQIVIYHTGWAKKNFTSNTWRHVCVTWRHGRPCQNFSIFLNVQLCIERFFDSATPKLQEVKFFFGPPCIIKL